MLKIFKDLFKSKELINYRVVTTTSKQDQKHVNKHVYTASTNSNINELINFFHYTNCGSYTFDCFALSNAIKILQDSELKKWLKKLNLLKVI